MHFICELGLALFGKTTFRYTEFDPSDIAIFEWMNAEVIRDWKNKVEEHKKNKKRKESERENLKDIFEMKKKIKTML